jgi:hypothetical protein
MVELVFQPLDLFFGQFGGKGGVSDVQFGPESVMASMSLCGSDSGMFSRRTILLRR